MPDYYTVLAQKIQETRDDPVELRAIVYETARLALRWQVEEQWPALSIIQSKIHIRELENAIVRVEAGVAGSSGRESREPAAAGLKAGRQSRKAKSGILAAFARDYIEPVQRTDGSMLSNVAVLRSTSACGFRGTVIAIFSG